MKTLLSCLLVALYSMPATADVLDVKYSRFYSHLTKLTSDDVNALQFAFGFSRAQAAGLCPLDSVQIITDKQTLPVSISAEQRFVLPAERALKLADAVVRISLPVPADQCDMSVQLQTRPAYLKTHYQPAELAFLVEQYEAFFNEMGSFLAFMMPTVEGLTVHFANEQLHRPLPSAPAIQGGQLRLSKAWLAEEKALRLPEKPLRITAIASRG